MAAYMYILECSDGTYYTGYTMDLDKRIVEHQEGKGANHTKERLPIRLLYVEEYQKIYSAYYRKKQIQGWKRDKKQALMEGKFGDLIGFTECKNKTPYKYFIED